MKNKSKLTTKKIVLVALLAAMTTVGPGFGIVGAVENYSALSNWSKIVTMLALLIGNVCTTFSEFAGIASGTAINGGITSVSTFVLLAVAPLNLIKGAMISVLTLLLYKRVARPLFGLHR